ncbi:hypothetical protein [Aquimarina sediminis]|uniref:hypothetical protein n=1 Tax=Aquimarina sediminis TaxID=2070536 RepID=UPI000CA08D6C|nr:hypothetical protein [Aquimarina sediminis]
MKNNALFFFIGCLFLTLFGYAQNDHLETQLKLLKTPPVNIFPLDSEGFLKMKNATFFTKNGDTDVFDINNENVHLIDFNNDGQKDIIYQDTRHYTTTVLLTKKDNDFVEIWNAPGALVDIKQEEQTTIHVLSRPIGCFDMMMLSTLVINSDNTLSENTIAHYSDTKMSTINKVLQQEIISGILRTRPVINDNKKIDPCTGDPKTGNQIRTIKNKEVVVIKTQKEWLLVILKEKDQSIIGWVKD